MNRRDYMGLPVMVENQAGSVRPWHDRGTMQSGETTMKYDYGFIDGHVGADGDQVDCYLGPNEDAEYVYVIHQMRSPDFKRFDEDKILLGFNSEAEAKDAYLAHRSDGEKAYGGMSAMRTEAFKAKLQRRTGSGKIRHEKSITMMGAHPEWAGQKKWFSAYRGISHLGVVGTDGSGQANGMSVCGKAMISSLEPFDSPPSRKCSECAAMAFDSTCGKFITLEGTRWI